jgi:glucosamine 6-phosphate synthetase-like amidotransferase/phosphosugar isomerase protein
MCALFGFLDYGKKIDGRTKKKLIQALSIACEARGTDACGISYVKNRELVIYKKAKPAHKLLLYFPGSTACVIGHTRMTTQGSQKFNANNHPFEGYAGQAFALAHNGVLYNDRTLRTTENIPVPEIETDSYIAVQLIEKQKELNFDSLKYMAEKVSGTFAFTVLSEDNTLYFVKGSNPLSVVHFEELGLYVYASTAEILKKALNCTILKYQKRTDIDITDGEIMSIDSCGHIDKTTFDFIDDSFGMYRHSFNDYYHEWYKSFENITGKNDMDVLLENCRNFGIDEEAVILLMDYGYEPEEIELMLDEPRLLYETINELLYGEVESKCCYSV